MDEMKSKRIEEDDIPHALEEVNKKLYSPTGIEELAQRRAKRSLSKLSYGVPTDWTLEEEIIPERKKMSIFKKFFLISLILFLFSLVFVGLKYFKGETQFSIEKIKIDTRHPDLISSGESFDLLVELMNDNPIALENASLTIEYLKGEKFGEKTKIEQQRRDLGIVNPQERKLENFKIELFGQEGEKREIKISLEYRTTGSSATFVKEFKTQTMITKSPVIVNIESNQSEIISGQEISIEIKVISNVSKILKNTLVSVTYPIGFDFKESNPQPYAGNNIWNLGDLSPGIERKITIKGIIIGEPDDEKIFRVSVGEQDKQQEVEIATLYKSVDKSFILQSPSLGISLLINETDKEKYPLSSKGKIRGIVSWINNFKDTLENVEISVQINSDVIDENSFEVENGFYDPQGKKVIWDKISTKGDLSVVNPGEKGNFTFSFYIKPIHSPPFPDNPLVNLKASITAIRLTSAGRREEVSGTDKEKNILILSNPQLTVLAYHGESVGNFVNEGPLPPKVGQKTTYTIVWKVTNSINDLRNGVVKAKLGPFAVNWTGKVYPENTDITFNSLTNEITWRIGEIKKGTGFLIDPLQVMFQIELIPTLAQLDQEVVLLENSIFTAEDSFAGVTLKNIANQIKTTDISDSNFVYNQGKVSQ